MQKNVKIVVSPFTPSFEAVDKMLISISPPYSRNEVTVQFNPNIQHYQEKADQPGVKVRQVMLSTPTDQTQSVRFDFHENNVRDVEIEGAAYNIKLMGIDQENLEGQNFLSFEFFVSWE